MSLAQQKSLFGESLPASSFRTAPAVQLAPVQAAAKEEKKKPESRHPLGKVYQDPRPDFTEDSDLWVILLVEADKIDVKLWDALLGFRCVGTRLFPTENGCYVIRPHIDPTGDCGWKSVEEYKAEAARWLKPFGEQLKKLLKDLGRLKSSWEGDDGNK